MIQTWIALVSTSIGSFISALISWIFARKKNAEEVNAQKVQNFDAAIAAYKKMYEDMIDDLKTQVVDVKNENTSLKNELSEARKQIITLTNFVLASALQKDNIDLNQESVNNLKKILD